MNCMKNGLKKTFEHRMSLIPRYNWDYTLADYLRSLPSVYREPFLTEKSLKEIFGKEPILTTSGRVSQYLILKALNLPEGSSVGVPLFVCPIVFEAILKANLTPKFLDIDLDDYTLSIEDLTKKKDALSAVIAVHMFGHPADMDPIFELCGKVPVIEDCAQALFSKYKGDYMGMRSSASFYSFRSGKYISAGEGSAIFAEDPSLYEAVKKSAETLPEWRAAEELIHCSAVYIKSTLYHKPWYGLLGQPVGKLLDRRFNITSKTGLKLGKISRTDRITIKDKIQSQRAKIDQQRQNSFYFLNNLRLNHVSLPREKPFCESNYYQFAIRLPSRETRDFMADYLFENGIDAAKYLDDVVDIARDNYGYSGDCPNAERCAESVLIIPNHYTLSDRDLEKIVRVLNHFQDVTD